MKEVLWVDKTRREEKAWKANELNKTFKGLIEPAEIIQGPFSHFSKLFFTDIHALSTNFRKPLIWFFIIYLLIII